MLSRKIRFYDILRFDASNLVLAVSGASSKLIKIYENDDFKEIGEFKIDNDLQELKINEASLVGVNVSDGCFFIYNVDSNQIQYQSDEISAYHASIFYDQLVVYKYDYEKLNQVTGIFNISTNSVHWLDQDVYSLYILNGSALGFEGSTLKCYDTTRELLKWKIDISNEIESRIDVILSSKSDIREIVSIYLNLIWLISENNIVYAVSLSDGQIRYVIEAIKDFFDSSVYYPKTFKFRLDSDSGKLVGLTKDVYIEIDCYNAKVSISRSKDSFEIKNIINDISDFAMDHNYIYFLQRRPGKLGIFNRNKKGVEWTYQFEDGVIPNQVKSESGHVYVLDTNHTLHIFERN